METPQLVKDYAPILHLHPDEGVYCCFPSDAEVVYDHYSNRWEEFQKTLTPSTFQDGTPCYFERWQDKHMTQLRYWFWYNFNRFPRAPLGMGEHLGDWEHVEVRVYSEDEVIWLLSNHLQSRLASLPAALTLPGYKTSEPVLEHRHIHAWAALGSHSVYPSPDSKPYCIGGVLCDKIADGGWAWLTEKNLVDLKSTNFFEFQGRWGDSRAPRSPTNDYNNRWRNAPDLKPRILPS
jgi:hypothetical protein